MEERKPTPTGFAILGLLSFGQSLAGYEIRQWARNMLDRFYPAPAQSQIYRELAMLEESGRITSTPIEQHDRPDKIVYELTDAGRATLADWAANEPVRAASLKHHAVLRLFLGHNTTSEHLTAVLERHRQTLLDALDELEHLSAAMTGDEATGYAAAVADWTADIYRGDLRGVDRTLKLLAN